MTIEPPPRRNGPIAPARRNAPFRFVSKQASHSLRLIGNLLTNTPLCTTMSSRSVATTADRPAS
jgi:hypothetical protein